jgi:hypothetical protein
VIALSKERYDHFTVLKMQARHSSIDETNRPPSSQADARPRNQNGRPRTRRNSTADANVPQTNLHLRGDDPPAHGAHHESPAQGPDSSQPVLDSRHRERRPSHDGRTSPPLRIRRPSVDGVYRGGPHTDPDVANTMNKRPPSSQRPARPPSASRGRRQPPSSSSRPSSATRDHQQQPQQQQQQQQQQPQRRPASRERPSSGRPSSGRDRRQGSSSSSSRSRKGGGKSAVAEPDVLMEDVLDRLEFLDYKVEFCPKYDLPPLPHRQYFAIAVQDRHERDIQFLYLIRMLCWLLEQINYSSEVQSLRTLVDVYDYQVRSKDVAQFSGFASDSVQQDAKNKVCDGVVAAIRRLRHYDTEIAPVLDLMARDLDKPDGFVPCFVLDRMLWIIMSNKSAEIDMARVRYGLVQSAEPDLVEVDAVDEQLDLINSDDGDNGGDLAFYVSHTEVQGRDDGDAKRAVPFDDERAREMAIKWPIEVERVTTLGLLNYKASRASRGQGDRYFDHLRIAQRNLKTMKAQVANMGDFDAHFKPHRETLERIRSVETRINESPTFAAMKSEYSELTRRLDAYQVQYDEILQRKKSSTEEQDGIEAAMENAKQQLEKQKHNFTNTSVMGDVKHPGDGHPLWTCVRPAQRTPGVCRDPSGLEQVGKEKELVWQQQQQRASAQWEVGSVV